MTGWSGEVGTNPSSRGPCFDFGEKSCEVVSLLAVMLQRTPHHRSPLYARSVRDNVFESPRDPLKRVYLPRNVIGEFDPSPVAPHLRTLMAINGPKSLQCLRDGYYMSEPSVEKNKNERMRDKAILVRAAKYRASNRCTSDQVLPSFHALGGGDNYR